MNKSNNNRGAALLIVLGCVALLTILIVAFLAVALTERSTSGFYATDVNCKLLAENAINLDIAQIRSATKSVNAGASVAWASQPGMIRTYTTSGVAGPYYKLYTWDNMVGNTGGGSPFNPANTGETPQVGGSNDWYVNKEVFTDLNEPINGVYPIADPTLATPIPTSLTSPTPAVEGYYVSPSTSNGGITPQGGSSNPLPMPVKWLYLLKDGTSSVAQFNPGDSTAAMVPNASVANPIVGRIAFWTDDESCKVNINTASEGTFWSQPLVNNGEEHSTTASGATPAYPYGYAEAIPASYSSSASTVSIDEFQRLPGHPATTCLSTVLGSLLPLTCNGAVVTAPTVSQPYSPYITNPGGNAVNSGTDYTNLSQYFLLSPRVGVGGSYGGSVVNTTMPGISPRGERLYDSVDELRFAPSLTADVSASGVRVDTTAPHSVLVPATLAKFNFFLTAHSNAPEVNLLGGPRISMWPLQVPYPANSTGSADVVRNTKDNLMAFCSSLAGFPYYFQRASVATTFTPSTSIGTASGVTANYSNTALGSSQDSAADLPTAGTGGASAQMATTARNADLMQYLVNEASALVPGFSDGASTLKAKYAGGVLEQTLTEMFDYIRSGVNTNSEALAPAYTYAPYGYSSGNIHGAYNPVSAGSVVPIKATINGVNTKGFGRTYTLKEVSIVFFACGWKDETSFTGDPPLLQTSPAPDAFYQGAFPGTFPTPPGSPSSTTPPNIAPPIPSMPDGLPDDEQATLYDGSNPPKVVNDPSTGHAITHYFGVGIPRTSQVQAYIILSPFCVSPGLPTPAPAIRYEIVGADKFTINGINMGFLGDMVNVVRNNSNASPFSEAGFLAA